MVVIYVVENRVFFSGQETDFGVLFIYISTLEVGFRGFSRSCRGQQKDLMVVMSDTFQWGCENIRVSLPQPQQVLYSHRSFCQVQNRCISVHAVSQVGTRQCTANPDMAFTLQYLYTYVYTDAFYLVANSTVFWFDYSNHCSINILHKHYFHSLQSFFKILSSLLNTK